MSLKSQIQRTSLHVYPYTWDNSIPPNLVVDFRSLLHWKQDYIDTDYESQIKMRIEFEIEATIMEISMNTSRPFFYE